MSVTATDFDAIRISLASPDQIKAWSYGEVTKPETINYRTLRPEKDGLFCERIFGPVKDWDCGCGKYKNIRYKGVICDRCGVEVTRSKVRRERMGHINLAAPVAHIWFSKGTPSRMGVLLDMSPKNLERILYFSQYIVTNVDEEARQSAIDTLKEYQENHPENILSKEKEEEQDIELKIRERINELEGLKVGLLMTESKYRECEDRYGEVFEAGMGAESILKILKKIDLEDLNSSLRRDLEISSGQKRKKVLKRLRVVESFRNSGNRPEWIILTMLPVLPPDLHPMVQLDGGRFATSDLNDLYRRVINRNNRLKHLLDLQAPEIIVRNEKRMLQEAVDALIDNGRRGRAIQGGHNHVLKSLSDLLRGKQGRFRQNLLGKRVDYSGRSVIVVGPKLKLNQCGLPKKMALELFKPLVMNSLVVKGYAHNIRSAKRIADQGEDEVWDLLEEVIQDHPVLLNRAPTLHRLGIQAFQPILIDGNAIQLHPLVCPAFNADFDGDQMAVHVPLSKEAINEAKTLMMSTVNMLSPSSGHPIVAPTLDLVLGNYYLTSLEKTDSSQKMKTFLEKNDALIAYNNNLISLREEIEIKNINEASLKTTVGRLIFNESLPIELQFINEVVNRKKIQELVTLCHSTLGNEKTTEMLDSLKTLGFAYATQSGITIAIRDMVVPDKKTQLLKTADNKIAKLEDMYASGLLSNNNERYQKTIDVWTSISDDLTEEVNKTMSSFGGIFSMIDSGAKGNIEQIKQMAGMRGLMSDPKGRIIELPIRSSFTEGLSVLEYFISTHGARKGLADTALRTADSGYLTRRLADVAQDVIITSEDDGTSQGLLVEDSEENSIQARISERIVWRFPARPIKNPKTGKILADLDTLITPEIAEEIQNADIKQVWVLSPLTSISRYGISQKAYGASLASRKPALLGEAIGIIAAQSIGEPGTQLTMRTFHTGGIAGLDITSGLPRVVELFEARNPKGVAILTEIEGKVQLSGSSIGRVIKISNVNENDTTHDIPEGFKSIVKKGDWVDDGDVVLINKKDDKSIQANSPGIVSTKKGKLIVSWKETEEREYLIPAASQIMVTEGEIVSPGQTLTAGPKSPHDILRIQGYEAVQRYLINEVQSVYRSQGVSIHDKHIEVIVRQMLRKVKVDSSGETNLLPNELVDRHEFEDSNNQVISEGKQPATASPVLLGVTRSSLKTESFLAAASFQETARVLTEAATNGAIDQLRGLKENVIIGRLIPARLDLTPEGRETLGILKNGTKEESSDEVIPEFTEDESSIYS
jgi:DNA-directed RNA polymerase subunit beta'